MSHRSGGLFDLPESTVDPALHRLEHNRLLLSRSAEVNGRRRRARPTLEHAMDTTVYFNPRCSKCRTTQSILEEHGVDARYVEYLDQAPTRDELEHVMALLGIEDPRQMMRTGERVYDELSLASAGREQLLDAMSRHPVLIERPIVIVGDRAVIARPPERVLDLL